MAWVHLLRRPITSGPVFRSVDRFGRVLDGRLSDKAVALVVKRSVGRVDRLDPARYAGHSLIIAFMFVQKHFVRSIAMSSRPSHRRLDAQPELG